MTALRTAISEFEKNGHFASAKLKTVFEKTSFKSKLIIYNVGSSFKRYATDQGRDLGSGL